MRTDYLLIATITRSGKFTGQNLYIRRKKLQLERKGLKKKNPLCLKLLTSFDRFSVLIKCFMMILLKTKM